MAIGLSSTQRVADTDLYLPTFGFGSAHLGELYNVVDEETSRATLSEAWDQGVRFYDTAPWYGRGLSEHRVGGFLRTRPRSEFVITTKVGRTLHRPADPASFDGSPWHGGLNFEVHFDYGYDGIMRSYEQALQRLALPVVDALVIHDLDRSFHGDETAAHQRALGDSGLKALQELKSGGHIKAIGMGINTADALTDVAGGVELDFVLVAMPYTLLDQSSLATGMAACTERGVSVIIGAPYASGVLATGSASNAKYGYAAAPEEIRSKVRAIEAVCAAHSVSLKAAALQFPLAHPAVVSIIPGASAPQEVAQNAAAMAAAIPAAFWSDLKAEGLVDTDAPVPEGVGG